jgi:hypothetical protein
MNAIMFNKTNIHHVVNSLTFEYYGSNVGEMTVTFKR